MLFNSLDFAIFFPSVFFLYWFVFQKNTTVQNILIILASYLFYGWWNWRLLPLIILSTVVDFSIGIGLSKEEDKIKRKVLLGLSLLVNLGLLGIFKYYNFFITNFMSAFSSLGIELSLTSLKLILPVGISFYTFQTLSYTIDVYNKKLKPTNNFISFSAFVCFFPQLVAGPIERAKNLLPQFYVKRSFEYSKAVDGLRQILWGFFKKIVIADNCAIYANKIFNNYSNFSGSTLVVGAIFFAIQIYGDFSGYSDIAIGVSRLFGFDLKKNFAFPYFSRDIAEFWRRWHISLSMWFRDYLYIPLGGSRGGNGIKIRNTFVIFIVSGLWHGANWTFVIWGFLNALYILPIMLSGKNRNNLDTVSNGKIFPTIKDLVSITTTFGLTTFAWIFFRSESVDFAFNYISNILSTSLFTIPQVRPLDLFVIVIIFFVIEWLGRDQQHALARLGLNLPTPIRWVFYYAIIITITVFRQQSQEFIYFQF